MGHFLYAAKAFDSLDKLDPDPTYWEAKRGACIGIFQQLIHQQSLVSSGKVDGFTSLNSTSQSTGLNSLHSSNSRVGSTGAGAGASVKSEDLQEVLNMIRNNSSPQVEYMLRIIKKWAKDNHIKLH